MEPVGNPFGGFSGGGFNINLEDLLGGDFFSGFFGGGRGRSRDRRGSDILVRHSIDLATVITGSEESIELDLPAECGTCSGTGAKRQYNQLQTMPRAGSCPCASTDWPFVNEVIQDCRDCGGTGSVIDSPCDAIVQVEVIKSKKKPFDSMYHPVQSMELVYVFSGKVNQQKEEKGHKVICLLRLKSSPIRGSNEMVRFDYVASTWVS